VAASSSRESSNVRIFGRRNELARVDRALELLAGGNAATVLQIVGESGIGKSKLLSYAIDRADRRGHLTLLGRAAELEADEPFGVFLSAVDRQLAELDGARPAMRDEDAAELAILFPTLAAGGERGGGEPPAPSGMGLDRYRLHRAMSSLLDALASGRRLLLALDDLHWADPASLELLLYLLRRPPQSPMLVIVTFRTGRLAPKVAAAVQQLQRDIGGDAIELRPLSAQEAGAFLPADLPSATGEWIFAESGGNPLYLQELVRAAREGLQSGSVPGERGVERVPSSVTAMIASELTRLSVSARELVGAAAVVGDPFEPELAGEIIEMDETETLAAVDELMDRNLVQGDPASGRFSFRHPIVRRAVYESAASGWRRRAHARAAAVLTARGASASMRARHVERSARSGDRHAAEVLVQAGHEAAPRAPAVAARRFRAALRLLPAEPSPERMALLLSLAASLGSAGSLEESREVFQEVLSLPAPDASLRGSAVALAAIVEHLLGKHDEAQGLLLAALSDLQEGSEAAATLELVIADGCFFSADWDGMRYWAQRAMAVGETSKIVHAGAAAALALAHYGIGNIDAAALAAREAAAVVDGLPDSEWARALQSICFLGWAEYCVGRLRDAEAHMRRALDVAAATGQQHLSAAMLVVRAMSNLALGRLALAAEQAETAIDTSMLSSNQLFLTWALTVRCMVEIEAGSPAAAVRFGCRALEAGVESRSPWSSVAALYLAEARLEDGDAERSRKQLLAGQSTPQLPPFPFYAVHAYELLARAELELGLVGAARRWASQAAELAEQLALPGPGAEAKRAQAMLLLDTGELGAALELARSSARDAESADQPVQAARSRVLAGIALGRAGDVAGAVAELERARDEFAEHGALRYRDHAMRALRELGVRAAGAQRRSRGSSTGVDALSERELAVARLVHEGRANRQTAHELAISVKTVENHLTNIFRRLEISSRSQLATLMERSRDAV
jgi:ATP/maltotriose-dependent transcriptional regulator MalT